MSKSEYKTESRVKTSTKFNSERKAKTGSVYGYTSNDDKQIILDNLDDLDSEQLKAVKKGLGVKSKATTKTGLKKAIKKDLQKDLGSTTTKKQSDDPMNLDGKSNAELREIARRYDLPRAGNNAKNSSLKRNIKKYFKENPQAKTDDDRIATGNTPEGSVTSVMMEDFQPINAESENLATYDVTIIDQDVEGHKEVTIEETSQQEGTFLIHQKTLPEGKEELIAVNIVESTEIDGQSKAIKRREEMHKQEDDSNKEIFNTVKNTDKLSKEDNLQVLRSFEGRKGLEYKDIKVDEQENDDGTFTYVMSGVKRSDEELDKELEHRAVTMPTIYSESYTGKVFEESFEGLDGDVVVKDTSTRYSGKKSFKADHKMEDASNGWERRVFYTAVVNSNNNYDITLTAKAMNEDHDGIITKTIPLDFNTDENIKEFVVETNKFYEENYYSQNKREDKKKFSESLLSPSVSKSDVKDLKRTESSDPDQRGFRGNQAENEVIDVFQDKKWNVVDRPSNGHDIILEKKNSKTRYYDVKEINETVDSGDGTEKGRVQIDKTEIAKIKKWEKENNGNASIIIKINKDDGTTEWKSLSLKKASQLMKNKSDPVKIPYSKIEKLPKFKDMQKKPEYVGGSSPASSNISQVRIDDGRILPDQPFDYPNSWSKGKLKKENKIPKEEAKRKKYQEEGIIPFHNTVGEKGINKRSSDEIFDLDELRIKVKTVDIAVEKQQLLTREEKEMNLIIGSFGGQNIQAKTDGQIFRGLYNQKASQDEIHQFFIADIIKVDSDDTGHYIAYMNEIYTGHKPKKIVFGKVEGKIDTLRANKFLGKQILSSLSYQRNKAISDALKASLSDVPIKKDLMDSRGVFSPLAYRDSAGNVQDLSVSEEQLAIADTVHDAPTTIIVDVVDAEKDVRFKYKGEDLDETAKPTLTFKSTGGEVKPLDSDTLLVFAVERMKLEPDAVQNMLEGLYQQGWINYPRADTIKAEDEPIYLIRDINQFKGTEQEKQLLTTIDESDKAFKQGKPYLQNGYWLLEQGKTKLKTNGIKLVDEESYYSDEGFDISLEKGLSPLDLTKYLVENDITTPATRTSIISAMKEAGILSLDKDRKYQLDRRGIYFAGAYQFLETNKIETSIELKKKVTTAKTIPAIAKIVNNYDIIDRQEMKYFVKKQSEELLDEQNDLTVLDGY